jgi:predicted GIY-YIG superfamily endonuclease
MRRLPTIAAKPRRWANPCHRASYGWQAILRAKPRLVNRASSRHAGRRLSSAATVVVIRRLPSGLHAEFLRLFGGSVLAMSGSMSGALCCVYIIRSCSEPGRFYTGVTADVNARIAAHNAGRSPHTSRFMPWELVVSIEFTEERRAIAFEKYLKSGSGVTFARRHLR